MVSRADHKSTLKYALHLRKPLSHTVASKLWTAWAESVAYCLNDNLKAFL
jgi:hypothetical protein